ncbi:Uncharacterized membrane protein YdjX, TVP38/TMEM64 family, SNARE-associated domain [Cohaesibacter sp. ES.047]|uniref:TVP38/TMEM64 family protein n=1 Tax=Cohaesibacter sp. ES.047 TaxID=1798205 RepID=UPI000BB8A003|nr:TVP38/TMEM64 family protein [Cohaesibacter sp. ES.047]SNY90458.1 Uncharacterized membrane protein YdjX, TVP38/TMEM64 family, SNARE-associated domain [Cohaesibacter sp. ES.047]
MAEQTTQTEREKQGAFSHFKRWGPLGLILLFMGIGYAQGWHHYLSLDALVSHRTALAELVADHFALTLLGYCLIYIAAVALSFPGASFITIAGGLLFGWAIGGIATVLAASLGATLIFLAARSVLGSSLRDRATGFVHRFAEGFRSDAFNYLLFLRLVPVFPFWLINIAPALFNVPLGTYVLATMLGILPGTFAYAFIGAGFDSVIAAQRAADPACSANPDCSLTLDPGALITGELIAAFAALGVVALIPPVLKAIRRRRNAPTSSD